MSFADLLKSNFGQGGSWLTDQGTYGLHNQLSQLAQALDALCADGMLTRAGLAVGSTTTDVAHDQIFFVIGGSVYEVAAEAAGIAPDANTEIPQGKYGAWALDVGVDGTVDISECDTNGDSFYDTEAEAIAALADPAANHVRLGYVTIVNTGGAFTPGTTDLNAQDVTATFYDASTVIENIQSIQP